MDWRQQGFKQFLEAMLTKTYVAWKELVKLMSLLQFDGFGEHDPIDGCQIGESNAHLVFFLVFKLAVPFDQSNWILLKKNLTE